MAGGKGFARGTEVGEVEVRREERVFPWGRWARSLRAVRARVRMGARGARRVRAARLRDGREVGTSDNAGRYGLNERAATIAGESRSTL